MENRYKINFDIKQKIVVDVSFKQGNVNSSVLEVNLLDGGLVVNVTGETIEFRFLKADNTVVYQNFTNGVTILDGPNGKIECILMSNTLAAPGIVGCEIYRAKDGKKLTTSTFNFTVETSIGDMGILSTNYISSIENIVLELTEARLGEVDLKTKIQKVDSKLIDLAISVKSFGAKGDGIADDTQAFKDAMHYVYNLKKNTGTTKSLYIPNGTYLIYDTINIYSYTHISGESRYDTIIKSMNIDKPLFYIGVETGDTLATNAYNPGGLDFYSLNICMDNLYLKGIYNVFTGTHNDNNIKNHGLQLDGCWYSTFKDIEISNLYGNGIEINKAEWDKFDRITVMNSKVGLNVDGGKSKMPSVLNGDWGEMNNVTNTFINCSFWNNNVGAMLYRTGFLTFIKCIFEYNFPFNMTVDGSFNGAKLESDSYYLPSVNLWIKDAHNSVFNDCYFESSQVDVLVGSGEETVFINCVFANQLAKSEIYAKHDILYRGNITKHLSINDGKPISNLFLITSDWVGTLIIDKCFLGSRNYSTNITTFKSIKIIDYGVIPLITDCVGVYRADGSLNVDYAASFSKQAPKIINSFNIPNITFGTAQPTGGGNGDMYFKYTV